MQVHAKQCKWPQNDLKESRNDPWEGSEVREEAVEWKRLNSVWLPQKTAPRRA